MKQMSPAEISQMIAQGVAAEVVRSMRCPIHAGAPTIAIVQAEADGLEYAISGCCADLRKRTRQAIDDLLGSSVVPA